MAKRLRCDLDETEQSKKRFKPSEADHLSRLSDELALRVFSYLAVPQLVVCQRLSHKYHRLAGDRQLWRQHYYQRFVHPRASRLPGLKEAGSFDGVRFASRASKWLDDEYLVRDGVKTDWKRQYKIRSNWQRGSCAVNEIPVAKHATIPPILVQMQGSIIYMADEREGLRAWSAKGRQQMIAQSRFRSISPPSPPTSLAVDSDNNADARVVVGFEDGSFSVFHLIRQSSTFRHLSSYGASAGGVLANVAICWPYVVTMTALQVLSLYRFEGPTYNEPSLLHSLKSHTVWPPLSTSLRVSTKHICMCVAYSLPTYLSGWTVGVQEIKVTFEGELLTSRVASAIDQHYRPLAFSVQPTLHHLAPFALGSTSASSALEFRHIHSKPTSLSYSHPYLLVSHPDNTLTLYLVHSNADGLSIGPGSRLWGHTSCVSGAQVGTRGKAVSISRRGDELRIWELEGGFASAAAKKRLASGDLSVQVKPGKVNKVAPNSSQSGLDVVSVTESSSISAIRNELQPLDEETEASELTLTRGWIGFDEENVVVLKEQNQGQQTLVVYDFT